MVVHKQSGYVMLLVLVVLLSGSAGLLRFSIVEGGGRSSLQRKFVDQLPLRQSRQFLLSYAAVYPYFYGPQGAGPGHLPCPDTDSPESSGFASASVNDGPNPPCGQRAIAAGKLPRKVSLSRSRYAFSDLATSRLSYEVDSRVINNPVNRVVNPATLTDDGGTPSALVSISMLDPADAIDAQHLAAVAITPKALLLAIRPGVSAWVIERMRILASDACVRSLFMPAESRSDLALRLRATGEKSDLITQTRTDNDERCERIHQFLATCSDHHYEEQSAVSHREDDSYGKGLPLLLSLADDIPLFDVCPNDIVSLLSIEQVPMSRHWFYRNRWQEWIHIETKSGCEPNIHSGCSLSYRSDNALLKLAEPLVLHWAL